MGSHMSRSFSLLLAALVLLLVLAAQSPVAAGPAPGPRPVATAGAAESNMYLLDQVGGTTTAVAGGDDFAYINEGQTLVILDVSDPTAPIFVGRTMPLPAEPRAIAVQGGYAYVAAREAGLRIVDISDPAAPTEISHLPAGSYARDVVIAGEFAYVLSDAGIHVVGISQPAQPVEVSLYGVSGCVLCYGGDLAVAGDHLYLAGPGSVLRILSLADPAGLELIGSLDTGFNAHNVAVVGNYAYLGIWQFICDYFDCWTVSELLVVDVADETNPQRIGAVTANYYPSGFAAGDDRVYMTAGGGVQIADVGVPDAPVLLGYVDTPGDATFQIALAGQRVYAADFNGGLRIIDVADPLAPAEIGFYDLSTSPESVALAGQLAIIAAGRDGLQIVEARSPTDHQPIGRLAWPGYALDVIVANGLAYVADIEFGLRIVSLADSKAPELVGALEVDGGAHAVAVSNGLAYLMSAGSGLHISDVRDPSAPVEIGHLETPGWGRDVAVAGRYAYVADDWAGLRVIDVSNPSRPEELSVFDTSGSALGVSVAGRYLYLADAQEGLGIIDIGDPRAPRRVSQHETPGEAAAVALHEEFAYVADQSGGLRVFDVRDPAAPVEVAFYEAGVISLDFAAVTGDVVYAVDGSTGLLVIQHWGPHTLSGRVTRTDGTPLPGAWVSAGARRAQTDAGGFYTLNRLQPGDYAVRAVAAGYDFTPSVRPVRLPPDGTGVDFTAAAWAGMWSARMPLAATP